MAAPPLKLGPDTRVLLTGASRGIGRALAEALARRGCLLGLVARSRDELEELAGSLPGDGHRVLPADVADRAQIEEALRDFGRCDVVVANAGIARYLAFQDLPLEELERLTATNWLGTAFTVKAALPGMLERGAGHVVIVSSGAGLRSFPQASVYGATKAAQRGFAEALRHELAGTGVSVTTVFPGEIRTHLHDHEKDHMPAWYHGDRSASPDTLAEKIVAGVERDARAVYYPPIVRSLRIMNGLSPRLADFVLRRLRGRSAAPRA
jgi:short-subunit dehydrogenase